jgi:type IV pilus assembly protein PilM
MTQLFYKDKPIIGLEISSTDVKVMSIDPKKWLVLGYGSLDLDPLRIKESLEGDSDYLSTAIQTLLKEHVVGELRSDHVVIGVPTAKSYARTFSIPTSEINNISDAVDVEVDQYIPLPASTLYIDHEIIEKDKKNVTVLMSAITKLIVDKATAAVATAGLETIMVEPSINAVGRMMSSTEDGNLPSVIVDIGVAQTDIAVVIDGTVRVTSSIPLGGNTFTIEIAKRLGLSLQNAHQLKVLNGLNAGTRQAKITSALKPTLDKIINETQKVIRYYNERLNKNRKLEQILIVGSGSNLPGIGEYFTNSLVMPARVASPWQKLDFGELTTPAKQYRSRYITVAGLASVNPGGIWK